MSAVRAGVSQLSLNRSPGLRCRHQQPAAPCRSSHSVHLHANEFRRRTKPLTQLVMEKLELVFDFGPGPAADFAAYPFPVGSRNP